VYTLFIIILDCPCIGDKPVFLPDDDGVNRSRSIIPIATNGDIFPWNNVRLPTFARPYSYHIRIHPNLTSLDVKGMKEFGKINIFCDYINI